MAGILGTDRVTQIGLIVHDIEATAKAYSEMLGLPMPDIIVTDTYDKALTHFYGNPTNARAKLAFFHVGENMDIELIEPDKGDSVWREFLDKRGEGVQHIAFQVKDGIQNVEKRLGDAGCPLTQTGEYTGGRYAYIDSYDQLKVDLELLEND